MRSRCSTIRPTRQSASPKLAVRRFAAQGVDIKYYHRANRSGYKAGALEAGLKAARGEFIAIFDADFIPSSDFLTRLMPHFADPRVGMVQARWGHINQDYSLLTKIQSILLDGHFVLEHGGRHRSGRFFNFNGIHQHRPALGNLPAQASELRSKLEMLRGEMLGVSSLTTAELRLLPFLPTHLSLAEISERLFVSRNTVKSQAISIYRKFGVSSRGETITRMHELGVVSHP